jgi:hypothetical protein
MVGRSPSGRVSSSGQLDALGRAREVLRRSEGEEEGSGSGAGSACASSADEAGGWESVWRGAAGQAVCLQQPGAPSVTSW